MRPLCADLAAEHADLDAIVEPIDAEDFGRSTPAVGWSVGDQLSHLTYFDERAVLALTDPDGFAADRDELLAAVVAGDDPSIAPARQMASAELLSWWRRARQHLLGVAAETDPKARVPWYGPAMSARSFVTARLMETWAHGQDVADALGVVRRPSARLRHVAHIGVGARRFAYAVHQLPMPEVDVRVELVGPWGESWTWGDDGSADVVRGPALDFCLLVTQRRHRHDVALETHGAAADEWLSIAQAFAGPPGSGRRPGQFAD